MEKDFCEITLRAEQNNQLGERYATITVSYTFQGKRHSQEVELSSTIIDRKELYIARQVFTSKGLNNEAKLPFPFTLTNLSNLHEINNIIIKPAQHSLFTLEKDVVDNMKPKSSINTIKLSYIPKVGGPAVSETWDVEYDIGKDAELEHRTLQFTVSAGPTTAPGALDITGYNFGKRAVLAPAGEIDVRINLQNPTAAKQGKKIIELMLTLESGAWDGGLELLKTSTCVVLPELQEGAGCYYDIKIRPKSSNAEYYKKLVLSYDNNTKVKFDLRGDITVLPPGSVVIQTKFP